MQKGIPVDRIFTTELMVQGIRVGKNLRIKQMVEAQNPLLITP